MSIRAYSNLATHFIHSSQNARIRSDMARLTKEMSSGVKSDLPKELGINRSQLISIDRSLETIGASLRNTQFYSSKLEHQQIALERIDSRRDELSITLLGLAPTPSAPEMEQLALQAHSSFDDMVSALNSSIGDKALFSGQNSLTPPLPSAEVILTDLKANINFSQPAATVLSDIRSYFEDSAGALEATHYAGGDKTGTEVRLTETTLSQPGYTALEPAVRKALAATATIALGMENPTTTMADKRDLLNLTRDVVIDSAGLAHLRGAIGAEQARTSALSAEQAARKTAITMERSTLTSADPYETAIELQAVQTQLETHYSIIARQSRLTLMDYL